MQFNPLSLLLASMLAAAAFSSLDLRILPLGASITTGVGSDAAGFNGYRLDLVHKLAGNMVSMLGTRREGYMPDNYNDGFSGFTINESKQAAIPAYPQKPNIVLIHAGTNDLDSSNPADIKDAPKNLGALIQAVIDSCPDVLVLVAQIIPRKDLAKEKLTQDFNAAVPSLVTSFTDQGHHVMTVDMHQAIAITDLSPDGKHPSPSGYQKMADAWYVALDQANKLKWIKSAPAQDRPGTCVSQPTWTAQPGPVFQEYNPGQNLWPGTVCKDDPKDNNTCVCTYGPSSAKPATESVPRPPNTPFCADTSIPTSPAVHFADLNGDGRAEYLWVSEDGAVTAYLNTRLPDPDPAYHNLPDPKNLTMKWLSQGQIAQGGIGGRREQIHLVDLNGDGRAEYLVVHPNGSVSAWLNTGSSDPYGPDAGKVGWKGQGLVFDGFGAEGAGVRFADLDGDGLLDYVHLGADGNLHAFVNTNNGCGDGGLSSWNDAGAVASFPDIVDRGLVSFADLNGNGRADLLKVNQKDGSVRARMNLGPSGGEANKAKVGWEPWAPVAGSVGQGGEGVQWGDLNGDGRAEYLVVDEKSGVEAWGNGCVVEGSVE